MKQTVKTIPKLGSDLKSMVAPVNQLLKQFPLNTYTDNKNMKRLAYDCDYLVHMGSCISEHEPLPAADTHYTGNCIR